jgi:hypothetical protein
MANPYRDAPPPNPPSKFPSHVDIATDDVSIEFRYLDHEGKPQCDTHTFKGICKAYITIEREYTPSELDYYTHRGSNLYSEWLNRSGDKQLFIFDDLVVPAHRMLTIQSSKKEYTVNTPVDDRRQR